MSKKMNQKSASLGPKKQQGASKENSSMTAQQAATTIIAPYVTEKTFNQIEKENKLAFIVTEKRLPRSRLSMPLTSSMKQTSRKSIPRGQFK